jgi:hypothetical protein
MVRFAFPAVSIVSIVVVVVIAPAPHFPLEHEKLWFVKYLMGYFDGLLSGLAPWCPQ